jgi:hypothetical protein
MFEALNRYLSSLEQKESFYLYSTVFIIPIFISNLFLFEESEVQLREIQNQLRYKKNEIYDSEQFQKSFNSQKMANSIIQQKRELEILKNRKDFLEKKLKEIKALSRTSNTLLAVSKLAKKLKLEITKIVKNKNIDEVGEKSQYSITFRSTYRSSLEFISLLQSEIFLFEIKELRLNKNQNQIETLISIEEYQTSLLY